MAEDFNEKATERTQIMVTTIFVSFAFFAVRFLYYPNKSEIFNLSAEMFHCKENQPQSPQRAQSFDIILCVLCDLCGFSNKKINQSLTNQTKPTQKELKPCN